MGVSLSNSVIEENELPNGWVIARLENISESNPKKLNPECLPETLFNFVSMSNVCIEFGGIDVSNLRPFADVKKGYTQFQKGDVLLAKITPCMENGKLAIVPSLINSCGYGSTEFHVLRPKAEIDVKWIAYFLCRSDFRKEARHNMTGTAGQLRVSTLWLTEQLVPTAPINEQKRIVAKIEELFSKLDAGIAALERVQTNLKRYRAAVLKAAVEGKLTEEWRKQNPNVEPASKLLQRILSDRRQKWEDDQLEKYQKSGKTPPKDWQSKYKEPTAPDTQNLPILPDSWCWASLGQITWSIKDGPHYSPSYVEEGIPFITGGHVRPSGVDFESAKRISSELHKELSIRCLPEKGDILYTKGGTTGIARVNTYDVDFNVWVHVAVLKLVQLVEPFYIQHVLNSPFCYAQSQIYTHGVGNQDLGLTRMVNIVLSLPPRSEQIEVIKQIDEAMAMIDHLEMMLSNNLKRASHLRQSILKQAFTGKLAPQDPNDEPAGQLLERIKKEKEKATEVKPAKRQRKKSDG